MAFVKKSGHFSDSPFPTDGNRYLTAEEAAKVLGLKESVIRNYLSLGRLTKYKFKTLTLLNAEEIQRCKDSKKH